MQQQPAAVCQLNSLALSAVLLFLAGNIRWANLTQPSTRRSAVISSRKYQVGQLNSLALTAVLLFLAGNIRWANLTA